MEEVLLRFHQIGKKIFEELDNQSLAKCREVNESWGLFIDGEKTIPFRIIKSLTDVPDTYLKKNFAKADLASVSELVKNIQHAYSEVHHEQHNFKYGRFGLGLDVGFIIERKIDGKQSWPRLRITSNARVLSKTIKKCVKRNSERPIKNLLAKLNTGKLFLTPKGDLSKSHPTNLSNGCGETVLHFAAKNGYLNVCKLIAENIQEKNPENFREATPLQWAEENDQYSVVEYFQTLLDLPLTRKSCPYCSGFRLSRLMKNHIKKEHPEKISMKRKSEMNPEINKAKQYKLK